MSVTSLARPLIAFTVSAIVSTCVFFFAATTQPANAQNVVAPSCPQGYVLSGSQCVQSAPTPTCPSGYTFSGGQCVAGTPTPTPTPAPTTTMSGGPWVFIIPKELGVRRADELDGAVVCVVSGSQSEAAVASYFQAQGMTYEPFAVNSARDATDDYQDDRCDTVAVSSAIANATLNAMDYPSDHMILPQRIGGSSKPVRPAATPPVQPTTPVQPVNVALSLQAELKRIGCLAGQVDGIWGNGSRAALRQFAQRSGLNLGTEPSQRALTEARNRPAGYCPKVVRKKKQKKQETPEARCARIENVCERDAQDICQQDDDQCGREPFHENMSGCMEHYGCTW